MSRRQLFDIGANLLDDMFAGVYRGKARHAGDLERVLERAAVAGVRRVVVTAGTRDEAARALALARAGPHPVELYSTVGVHPTRCGVFEEAGADPDAYERALAEVLEDGARDGRAVAVGECGLDYARLQFCPRETQLRHFGRHFRLAERARLPMFLHMRDAADDMVAALERHREQFAAAGGGVVHSFDGSAATAARLVALGAHIGVNGCSLRTAESLEAVRSVPADRLLLETDAPWCGIRATHPGFGHVRTAFAQCSRPERHDGAGCVKGRAEPCHLVQVLEVVAAVRGDDEDELAEQVWRNTLRLFKLDA